MQRVKCLLSQYLKHFSFRRRAFSSADTIGENPAFSGFTQSAPSSSNSGIIWKHQNIDYQVMSTEPLLTSLPKVQKNGMEMIRQTPGVHLLRSAIFHFIILSSISYSRGDALLRRMAPYLT